MLPEIWPRPVRDDRAAAVPLALRNPPPHQRVSAFSCPLRATFACRKSLLGSHNSIADFRARRAAVRTAWLAKASQIL